MLPVVKYRSPLAKKAKFPKYLEDCKRNDQNYAPMVVEVFGAWGQVSKPILRFVAWKAAFAKAADPDRRMGYLRQGLSVALQRQNAISLLKFLPSGAFPLERCPPHTACLPFVSY